MPAATHQEISSAKDLLERFGYSASTHENGHLVVNDPVYASRPGDTRLVLDGYTPVAIRSYGEACSFISARS